jgi:hypothetical protein
MEGGLAIAVGVLLGFPGVSQEQCDAGYVGLSAAGR